MTHDLPPLPKGHRYEIGGGLPLVLERVFLESDLISFALSAIAPYKAEIVNLRQLIKKSGRTQLREENSKLRELLRYTRDFLNDFKFDNGLRESGAPELVARIDAALRDKP